MYDENQTKQVSIAWPRFYCAILLTNMEVHVSKSTGTAPFLIFQFSRERTAI